MPTIETFSPVCPRVRMGTPFFASAAHARLSIRALIMVAAAYPRNLRLVDIFSLLYFLLDAKPDLHSRVAINIPKSHTIEWLLTLAATSMRTTPVGMGPPCQSADRGYVSG